MLYMVYNIITGNPPENENTDQNDNLHFNSLKSSRTVLKKREMFNDWRDCWTRWLMSGGGQRHNFSEVDEEAAAPLLLRCLALTHAPILAVCPTMTMAEQLYAELQCWCGYFELQASLRYLPDAAENRQFIPENEIERIRVLHETLKGRADITVASVVSLLTVVPPPAQLSEREIVLRPAMRLPFNDFLERLVEMDYDDEFEVCTKGEFARRGGIVDVFSPAHEFPVRIEFWGDDIESLREFNPETQRSLREIEEYRLIPRSSFRRTDETGVDYFAYMEPYDPDLAVLFPEECLRQLERFAEPEHYHYWQQRFAAFPPEHRFLFLDPVESSSWSDAEPAGCYPAVAHLRKALPEELAGDGLEIMKQMMAEQVAQWVETGYRVTLLGRDEATFVHLQHWCEENQLDSPQIEIGSGMFPHGLILPEGPAAFLTEKEIFATQPMRKNTVMPVSRRRFNEAAEEEVFKADIDEGDLVVHLGHGIGIFRGIREVERRGACREVMVIEYQDQALIYVPVWQAALVSKYIGARAGSVALHKLGGKTWMKAKIEAERSVRAFALDMLRVQALRSSAVGFAFPPDDLSQRVFEDSFPYEDTADQVKAVADIKHDMCEAQPMDRLLCGDVGYGKTEVAIRAAFKAVMAGKQVAVLVPTTVLAQQHYYSFRERFAGYPVIIEMLSRFRSKSEQNEVIFRLKQKKVDIVIGTHRMVQDDIEFADLGLVVIDEEQRFGVTHKEKLKSFRSMVDVLTMTATPIPRTLYMSMSGLRDLSTIVTAPNLRLPVHTVVVHYDEKFIDDAIRKEVQRGGQVFYLHNRVKSIDETADRMRERMPDIRFGVGHGQMDEDELEQSMAEFLAGQIDVFICTTIIESGLDIPNANTIIIERADRFGLAELYQLRGRVGRWNRQAYAYLLLPKGDIITNDARKRLAAIRRYTHLGAGFKLALRDLEIRGAGNLLGAEQSGHINNVGFDLYCQLLRSTIGQLKGEAGTVLPEVDLFLEFVDFAHVAEEGKVAAGFPPDYINSERLRIEAYRRLGNMFSEEQVALFEQELEDRYGKLPEAAKNMLTVARIRIAAAETGFHSLKVQDNKILLENRKGVFRFESGRLPILDARNPAKYKLDHVLQMLQTIHSRFGHG